MASLIDGLGGSVGFGENQLGGVYANDYSPAIDLNAIFPNGLQFYGTPVRKLYVNETGSITFGGPNTSGVPSPLGSDYAAGFYAFWAAIDVRFFGRMTPSPGGTSQGSNRVYWDLDPTNHRIIATWDDVGHYSSFQGYEQDAFQIILEDHSGDPGRSAGDFDVEFRYETIAWAEEAHPLFASAGTVYHPARAGYSDGKGIAYELPASGDAAALLALPDTVGNTGLPGVWHFEIRNADSPERVALVESTYFSSYLVQQFNAGTTIFHLEAARSGNLSGTLNVDWAVTGTMFNSADPSDFVGGVLPRGSVTFGPGETTADIAVPIQGHAASGIPKSFQVTISNPVSSLGHQVLTPLATVYAQLVHATPTLSITPYISHQAGDTGIAPYDFVLTRTGDLSQALTVTVAIRAPGKFSFQASPEDLVGGERDATVTIPAGAASATLEVQVVADRLPGINESFTATITGFTGGAPDTTIGNSQGIGAISDARGAPSGIFGDPHLITLDGRYYEFQATGEFLLLETLPGQPDPFRVQVRLEADANAPGITYATRLAAEVHGTIFEITAGDAAQLFLGGHRVAAPGPEGLDLDGDGAPDLVVAGSTCLLRLGPGGERLMVRTHDGSLDSFAVLDGARAGQIHGLLGDFDGNPANDLRLRDGTIWDPASGTDDLLGAFADGWRVGPGGIEAALFSDAGTIA